MVASFLGFEVDNIIIYPFGGLTIYESKINTNIIKELLVCISGPLIQIIFMLIVYLLKDFIADTTYFKFFLINKYLLMFNLLPIVPLDGGRLLNLVFDSFIPYRKSLIISSFISVILSICFSIFFLINKDYLIFALFLITFFNVYNEIKSINTKQNKFLLERYLFTFNYNEGKTLLSANDILRNKKHKILRDNYIYTEKNYLKKYIFNS